MPDSDPPEHVLLRPEMDRLFESLSDRHRRMTLLLLTEGTVETKGDVMIRAENDAKTDETALVHAHLPKLADAGYVEYGDDGELSPGPRFDEVEPLFELVDEHADELPPDWP